VIENLEVRFQDAVQSFWDARSRQAEEQIERGRIDAGTRGSVTGGAQMGALDVLITDILLGAGLDRLHVKTRTALEIPGYYRPEKQWDLLVVANNQLVLAIELKSQAGSFGKNYNNRVEEAIGNSEDVWTAYREGRFGKNPPPFLGWMMLLEDCPAVHRPVRAMEPYFSVDPAFRSSGQPASYAERYARFCERLVLERKYNSACIVTATQASPTEISYPSSEFNLINFAAAIEAHARLFAERTQ
jgi:Restriction endonuclease XhoI